MTDSGAPQPGQESRSPRGEIPTHVISLRAEREADVAADEHPPAAGFQHPSGQRRGRGLALRAGDGDHPAAQPSRRQLQFPHHRYAGTARGLVHHVDAPAMLLVFAVGEIDARHVEADADHFGQDFEGIGGRAERRDDLRARVHLSFLHRARILPCEKATWRIIRRHLPPQEAL